MDLGEFTEQEGAKNDKQHCHHKYYLTRRCDDAWKVNTILALHSYTFRTTTVSLKLENYVYLVTEAWLVSRQQLVIRLA